MPSRKHRRRRAKERRHEYEYVYVDEEGREVDVEPDEVQPKQKEQKTAGQARASQARASQARAGRRVDPPSWRRVGKRALVFAPLMFLTISILDKGRPLTARVSQTAFLLAFFLPLSYFMDTMLYRAYLRRTEATRNAAGRDR